MVANADVMNLSLGEFQPIYVIRVVLMLCRWCIWMELVAFICGCNKAGRERNRHVHSSVSILLPHAIFWTKN